MKPTAVRPPGTCGGRRSERPAPPPPRGPPPSRQAPPRAPPPAQGGTTSRRPEPQHRPRAPRPQLPPPQGRGHTLSSSLARDTDANRARAASGGAGITELRPPQPAHRPLLGLSNSRGAEGREDREGREGCGTTTPSMQCCEAAEERRRGVTVCRSRSVKANFLFSV